ncbi:MAG TPA: cupin domain-containing protein [Alphaproteobacteria bacterium]|nr:cupin domain-containing protein [Alphaproteobacteria bacterium]
MSNLGRISVLPASCNIQTVEDGRGAIFTWLPKEPILEFNMVYFQPNKVRGNHYHPEFTEYFLVVEGTVVMVTKDALGNELNMHASKGMCFRIPPNTSHAVHAVTQSICIACLTKPWDECHPPIVHDEFMNKGTKHD